MNVYNKYELCHIDTIGVKKVAWGKFVQKLIAIHLYKRISRPDEYRGENQRKLVVKFPP